MSTKKEQPEPAQYQIDEQIVETAADLAVVEQRSTAVAPLSEEDEFLAEASGEGLEGITEADIRLPRLTIMQPTSPLVADDPDHYRAGDIVNVLSLENFGQSFDFVPVYFFNSRTQWATAEIGSDIECRSADGIIGTNQDARHAGGDCLRCPLSQWGQDKDGKSINPVCTQFKNLIIVDETLSPIVFAAKRTAIRELSAFISRAAAVRHATTGKVLPLYAKKWKMTTKKNQKDKQTWYTPVITPVTAPRETLPLEQMKVLRELSRYIKESQSHITYDQTEEVVSSKTADMDDEVPF